MAKKNQVLNEPFWGEKYKNLITETTEKLNEKYPDAYVRKVPLMVPNKPTANDRTYSRGLCENVKEVVENQIDEGSSIGELDHPEERSNINLKNVAIKVLEVFWENKLVEDTSNDVLYGIIQILEDSPSGSTLAALDKSGVSWGCSSRGVGTVYNGGKVDENSYEFVAFDAVDSPSIGMLAESKNSRNNYRKMNRDLNKMCRIAYQL